MSCQMRVASLCKRSALFATLNSSSVLKLIRDDGLDTVSGPRLWTNDGDGEYNKVEIQGYDGQAEDVTYLCVTLNEYSA